MCCLQCINSSSKTEGFIKKSRFIAILIPCQTENECLQQLKQLQHKYADASHIVFAYRIKSPKGITYKHHDAGEPSGTAGKPVFQHLEGKNLVNILLVVVRYFGGIKLGSGGLTRAYGNAAKKIIDSSTISEYIEFKEINLTLDYNQLQNFEYQLKKLNGWIVKQNYSEKVHLVVKLPEKNANDLVEKFHKQVSQRL